MFSLIRKIVLIAFVAFIGLGAIGHADENLDELDAFLSDILGEEVDDSADEGEEADTPANDGNADTPEDHDSAQEILDQVDDDKWKYLEKDISLGVNSLTETSVDFLTSKAEYDGTPVTKYKVYYSEKTLATQKLSLIKDMIVTSKDDPNDANKVMVTLDKLKPDTKYFVVISPVHPSDPTNEPLTMITDEVNFTTKSTAPDPEPAKEESNAEANTGAANNNDPAPEQPAQPAGPKPTDKIFNGVSYTNTDNKVDVKWLTNVNGVDKVEVHLRHQGESNYTNVGAPAFTSGAFSFNVDKSGNYFLKLKGKNATGDDVGREHIQTVKVAEVKNPTENDQPAVTNPPKVGPTTDLIIGLLILGMIVYMMYRFRRVKA